MNQWRLHVENFGKIAKATVDVSPFMIFVGKNNSGKSYLMVLLWGILTEAGALVDRHLDKHPKFQEVTDLFRSEFEAIMSNGQGEFVLGDRLEKDLIGMFSDILNENIGTVIEKVFRHPVTIGSVKIERTCNMSIKVRISQKAPSSVLKKYQNQGGEFFLFETYVGEKLVSTMVHLPRTQESMEIVFLVIYIAISELICHDFYEEAHIDGWGIRKPLYLPASRTGFMHSYRAIVGNVFRMSASPKLARELLKASGGDHEVESGIQGAELNLPTIEFLTGLQKRNLDSKRQVFYQDEIRFLNNEVFQGRVITDEKNQVRFVPRDIDAGLPLHVTSSLVAELAPVSLFLESNFEPTLWIIEEVESHLHSEIQLTVARLLFRLFNKGNSMWLTTHSDNLAQQINNLLTLSQHPLKEQLLAKLKYDEKELLGDLSVIRAYQFETKDGVTEVEQLELGKYGFEMKTFNNTLDRLVRETHLIQNYAGENND